MDTAKHRYIVGLTGGIASGKTAASDEFARCGAYVVDADVISRELTAKSGAALEKIAETFPGSVTNGTLDRAALRARVFSEASARKQLESILHPLIRAEIERRIHSADAKRAPYVMLVIPLLFESNAYASMLQASVVVDVPVSLQLERMSLHRGLDTQVARGILASQATREARLSRTQFVLSNTDTLLELHARVRVLHSVFCANAQSTFAIESLAKEIA